MERPDGYKGLAATYGLHFADNPRIMDLGLLTRALKDKQVDLIAGNTTDGLIPALDLFVLEDDKHYFPPYEAVPIIRQETLARHPEVKQALDELGRKNLRPGNAPTQLRRRRPTPRRKTSSPRIPPKQIPVITVARIRPPQKEDVILNPAKPGEGSSAQCQTC